VTVLWRPLQEMNGNAYWWASGDPASYILLWQQMFTYFTNTRGLHNLIWVWCAAATPQSTAPLSTYYPGSAYVDILGQDVYNPNIVGLAYNDLLALAAGRPIALCEFGPSDDSSAGTYNWLQMLDILKTSYPKIAYFMAWSDLPGLKISLVTNQNAKQLMNDPQVTTLDKINLQGGSTSEGDGGTGGDGLDGADITGIVIGSVVGAFLLVLFLVVIVVVIFLRQRSYANISATYARVPNDQL